MCVCFHFSFSLQFLLLVCIFSFSNFFSFCCCCCRLLAIPYRSVVCSFTNHEYYLTLNIFFLSLIYSSHLVQLKCSPFASDTAQFAKVLYLESLPTISSSQTKEILSWARMHHQAWTRRDSMVFCRRQSIECFRKSSFCRNRMGYKHNYGY